MGIRAIARICFGVDLYNDEHEVPWAEYEDIEDWWEEIGFKPSVEIYTEGANDFLYLA